MLKAVLNAQKIKQLRRTKDALLRDQQQVSHIQASLRTALLELRRLQSQRSSLRTQCQTRRQQMRSQIQLLRRSQERLKKQVQTLRNRIPILKKEREGLRQQLKSLQERRIEVESERSGIVTRQSPQREKENMRRLDRICRQTQIEIANINRDLAALQVRLTEAAVYRDKMHVAHAQLRQQLQQVSCLAQQDHNRLLQTRLQLASYDQQIETIKSQNKQLLEKHIRQQSSLIRLDHQLGNRSQGLTRTEQQHAGIQHAISVGQNQLKSLQKQLMALQNQQRQKTLLAQQANRRRELEQLALVARRTQLAELVQQNKQMVEELRRESLEDSKLQALLN